MTRVLVSPFARGFIFQFIKLRHSNESIANLRLLLRKKSILLQYSIVHSLSSRVTFTVCFCVYDVRAFGYLVIALCDLSNCRTCLYAL